MRYLLFSVLLILIQIYCMVSGTSTELSTKEFLKICLRSFPETFLIMTFFYLLKSYFSERKFVNWIVRFLGILYIFIFFAECYFYYISGEWITILALSNIDQAYLLISSEYILVLLGIIAFILSYLIFVDFKNYSKPNLKFKCLLFFLITISAAGFYISNVLLIKDFNLSSKKTYTPVFSLIKNIYRLKVDQPSHVVKISVGKYPFEKDYIYKNKLPFVEIKKVSTPNIIIIFTEGTSARLIGSYNNKYKDLTPNIDGFANNSMQVTNYFNHTAATFRGTFGQLASAFSIEGGGKEGWHGDNKNELKMRKIQTLPKLLGNEYKTVFFSPHAKEDPYTDLLENIGFNTIFTRDEINKKFFSGKAEIFYKSIKDVDMYKALIKYLEGYQASKPFFISIYTFDTHVGVKLPAGVERYSAKPGLENVESLNSLHNLDRAFGVFWEWFRKSDFIDNTIVVFTADHAHFYDTDYYNIVKNDPDYNRVFVDKIPFFIYDPFHNLPKVFDAKDRTSLDLAPTICHIIGKQGKNSFLGKSIFEPVGYRINIATSGSGKEFYGIYDHKVWDIGDINKNLRTEFDAQYDMIHLYHECLRTNRVFH